MKHYQMKIILLIILTVIFNFTKKMIFFHEICHQEVVLFFGFFIALLCFPFCIIRSLLRPQKNLIIHNSNNVKKIDLKHYMSKPQEFYVPIIVASKRVLRLIWPNVWRIFKNLLYFLVQNFLISALIFLWSVTNMYNMQRVIN